jgi:polyhydroxyalkanoate synthase
VLAACLAAWLAAGAGVTADDVSVNTLTLLNTLLDYSDPGGVDLYTSANMLAAIEQKVTDAGYLDGSIMSVAFSLLRAERNYWPQFVHNYLKGLAPKRDPLSFWNFDVTNLPARMTLDFLHDFYRDNRLARPDELELCGRKLDLSQIDCPTIAVACERDHLVPWRAAYASAGLIGTTIQFILAQGGHVTGIIRPPGGQAGIGEEDTAKHQASYRQLPLTGNSSEWKGAAEDRSGSWWPGWDEAMAQYHGPMVPARFPGGSGHTALEPSPGSYVQAKPEA